jgi:hypothetical protein
MVVVAVLAGAEPGELVLIILEMPQEMVAQGLQAVLLAHL